MTVNTFPLDEEQLGFTNNADALTTGLTLAQSYITSAETFATAATTTANLTTLLPCDPAIVAGQDACAQAFIAAFGQRSLRRPLTAAEKTRYLAIYTTGKVDGFAQGISLVIQSFLESPYFLYRVETGAPTSKAGVAAVNPYEMASRLSYFLWGTMPDAQLFADAAASKLGTVAEVEAEARRMLTDPKAKQAVGTFHQQWLAIGLWARRPRMRRCLAPGPPRSSTTSFRRPRPFSTTCSGWMVAPRRCSRPPTRSSTPSWPGSTG